MKKRMFITTIVMTLVLAVALTTSSLAWFSSANASVTAQAATFTAASASTGNVSLKIKNDSVGALWGTSINLQDASGLKAAIPVEGLFPVAGTAEKPAPKFESLVVSGQTKNIAYGNYVWPTEMSFNSAKIDQANKFTIGSDSSSKVAAYTAIEYTGDVKTAVDTFNGSDSTADNNTYLTEKDGEYYKIIIEQQMTKVNKADVDAADYGDPDKYYYVENNLVETTEGAVTYIYQLGKTYVFSKNVRETTADEGRNKVDDLVAGSDFYTQTFYLKNADKVSQINGLTFTVGADVTLPTQAGGDVTTATSYVAFILFNKAYTVATTFVMEDESYTVDDNGKYTIATASIIPASSVTNAGKYVIPANADTSKLPDAIGTNYIQLEGTATSYVDWASFAAFTIKIEGTQEAILSENEKASWQYADLDAIVDGSINTVKDRAFKYNGVDQQDESLKRQEWDADNSGSFILNTANLNKLNKKAEGVSGVAKVATADENPEAFVMYAQEEYRVDLYFWLDGLTLSDATDATITNFSVNIAANQ